MAGQGSLDLALIILRVIWGGSRRNPSRGSVVNGKANATQYLLIRRMVSLSSTLPYNVDPAPRPATPGSFRAEYWRGFVSGAICKFFDTRLMVHM